MFQDSETSVCRNLNPVVAISPRSYLWFWIPLQSHYATLIYENTYKNYLTFIWFSRNIHFSLLFLQERENYVRGIGNSQSENISAFYVFPPNTPCWSFHLRESPTLIRQPLHSALICEKDWIQIAQNQIWYDKDYDNIFCVWFYELIV